MFWNKRIKKLEKRLDLLKDDFWGFQKHTIKSLKDRIDKLEQARKCDKGEHEYVVKEIEISGHLGCGGIGIGRYQKICSHCTDKVELTEKSVPENRPE